MDDLDFQPQNVPATTCLPGPATTCLPGPATTCLPGPATTTGRLRQPAAASPPLLLLLDQAGMLLLDQACAKCVLNVAGTTKCLLNVC